MANPFDTPTFGDDFVITFDIDLVKIMERITDWRELEDAIERGIHNGIIEFSDKLSEKLISNMILYGLGDTNLISTIRVIPKSDGIELKVADYGIYVEYGTGDVGSKNSHPMPWLYDVNSYGQNGWWYPTTASDTNRVKRVGKDGKIYGWTKGQKSKPFMYDTWLWGRRSVTQILNKNINREIKKIKGVR